jgi:ABC-type antimicrobial peptide transport system permease subunit
VLSDFPFYFILGLEHILDWQGYDHILFIIALSGSYSWSDWRQVLLLVTAFTIGHSLTLALSVFNLVTLTPAIIEFLIPVTILITTGFQIIYKQQNNTNWRMLYGLALAFGLIHGLGFSNYLKSLLGKDISIVNQLLAFNVGLECGQLLVVVLTLTISYLAIQVLGASRREWNLFLASAIFGIALTMAITRLDSLLA